MEETTQNNQDLQENKSSGGKIIGIVVAVVIIGLLLLIIANKNKITELTKSLTQTQNEVENVATTTEDAQQDVAQEVKEGVNEIAESIRNIDNPAIRLALTKAYAEKLKTVLSPSAKEDLDTIVLYIERQPNVLVTKNPSLPTDVQQAITNLKTELSKVKANAVATSASTEATSSKVGSVVTIQGTLEYVESDQILSGGLFSITDTTTNETYYFYFNPTNTKTYQDTLVGKEVTIDIKITSDKNGVVTYDVVSGPTLASPKPTTSPKPTASPKPTTSPKPTIKPTSTP